MEPEPFNKAEFCRTVCAAAARLGGLTCREEGSHYEFFDQLSGAIIKGQPSDDKQEALTSACQALIQYLNASQQGS